MWETRRGTERDLGEILLESLYKRASYQHPFLQLFNAASIMIGWLASCEVCLHAASCIGVTMLIPKCFFLISVQLSGDLAAGISTFFEAAIVRGDSIA